MIGPTMTIEEIQKEINMDYGNVARKAFSLSKALRGRSEKSCEKQAERTYDYISPRKNNWIIHINFLAPEPLFVFALHYMDASGFNAIIVDNDLTTLAYYSPEFVEEYNEKCFNKNGFSRVDVFKQYIRKNATGSIKYVFNVGFGAERFFTRTKEGICLGYIQDLKGTTCHRCITFL